MSSKSFNNKSSSKSSQNGKKSKRYEGQITVDSSLMGPLIGRGGCNIRRICSTCRFGTFIKGLPDGITFTISSYSAEAVRTAAKMIKMDEEALIDPSKRSSKPFQTLNMMDEYVSHVVGKDGGGIRSIMDKVGDGCYIVHRDGEFHITANSNDDVQYAIKLILRERDAYILWSNGMDEEPAPLSSKPVLKRMNTNTFAGLLSDSEDDEEPEEMAYRAHLAQELKVEGHRLSDVSVQRFIQASRSAGVSAQEMNQSAFPSLKTSGEHPNITLRVSNKTPWGNTDGLISAMNKPVPLSSIGTKHVAPLQLFVPPTKDTRSWADMADSDSDSE
jgi:hypothetical protein